MNRRSLLLSGIALCATGCGAPGTTLTDMTLPDVPDSPDIGPGLGIVVTRINLSENLGGDAPPIRLTIEKKPSLGFKSGLFTLRNGENFHVVALKPGTYQWGEIFLGTYGSVFHNDFAFDCIERQVTYIGDVDISLSWLAKSYQLRFVDRARVVRDRFASAYPKMSSSYKLVSGVTRDPRQKA